MSFYDYNAYFWKKNEYDKCSFREFALYYTLLDEANRQYWVSPFKATTQMLMARIGTSKLNIIKAREGLVQRGLIRYAKADGKGKPGLYTLLLGATDNDVHSPKYTKKNTPKYTGKFTSKLPLYIKEEKEDYKEEVEDINNKEEIFPSPSDNVLPISVLHGELMGDAKWKHDLSKRLVAVDVILSDNELDVKINEFFDDLRGRKVTCKDKDDCRDYVFNWIKYHIKNSNYGRISKYESKIGRAQITANRPEDYDGIC